MTLKNLALSLMAPGQKVPVQPLIYPHFRPVRENQAARLEGKANWQEEEDDGEKRQSESLLQRVLCLHGGAK